MFVVVAEHAVLGAKTEDIFRPVFHLNSVAVNAEGELKTAVAAKRAGVCTKTILRWHDEGTIAGRLSGRDLLIDVESLDAHIRARRVARRKRPGPKPLTVLERQVRRRARVFELIVEGRRSVPQLAKTRGVTERTIRDDVDSMRELLVELHLWAPKRPMRKLPNEERECPRCGRTYKPRAWRFADGGEQTCRDCVPRSPADEYLTKAEQLQLLVLEYVVGSVERVAGKDVRITGTLEGAAARVGMSKNTARNMLAEAGYEIRPPTRRSIRREGQFVECAAKRSKNAKVREACECKPRFVYSAQLRRQRLGEITLSRGCAQRLVIVEGLGEADEEGFVPIDRQQLGLNPGGKVASRVRGRAAARRSGRQGGKKRSWAMDDVVRVHRLRPNAPGDEQPHSIRAVVRLTGLTKKVVESIDAMPRQGAKETLEAPLVDA